MSKVKIGPYTFDIFGLNRVMEEMLNNGYRAKPNEEIQAELLKRLSRENYIPDVWRKYYGEAFLREFKKLVTEHSD